MDKIMNRDQTYLEWIKDISLRFKNSQLKAATMVNKEMLLFYLYWERYIKQIQRICIWKWFL